MSNQDFDFAAIVAEDRRQIGRAINDNAYRPDDAVRAMQVAPVVGVPPEVVAGDLPHYDEQARVKLANDVISNSPFIQSYIANNGMASKVSNDDWGNLAAVGEAMQKMRLPVPGLTGISVPGGGSILGDAWAAMKDAFPGEQLGKDYAALGETLAQTPGFQNAFLRHAAQAGIGATAGVLHGLGAAGAGVAAAVGSTAKQMGVPEAWANRLTRDAYVALNVAMPELALGAPAHLAGRAMRQDVGGFVQAVQPYIQADKTPPMGVHPVIDQMHMDQAALDLTNLQAALKTSLDSATRERAPDMYADFIRGITDGEIGISADAVRALYPEGTIPTPGDGILGWVPRIEEQLRVAEATGGDIQVPVADWLAKVDPQVAKGLEEFIRARPDGVSVAEAKSGILAWHGSPHTFEAFDIGRIGTGEGAQSYGHGLYVAENPAVAADYAKNLGISPEKSAFQYLKAANGDRARAIEMALDEPIVGGTGKTSWGEPLEVINQAIELLKSDKEIKLPETGGNTYRVRIKRDPSEFLDWDKPLAEQPEAVKALVERIAKRNIEEAERSGFDSSIEREQYEQAQSMSGAELYRSFNDDKEASKILAEAGIPGIKYLDQGSRPKADFVRQAQEEVTRLQEAVRLDPSENNRSALADAEASLAAAKSRPEGTRNYVIFSDADLEIIERNGEAIRAARQQAGLEPPKLTAESQKAKSKAEEFTILEPLGSDAGEKATVRVLRDKDGAPKAFDITYADGRGNIVDIAPGFKGLSLEQAIAETFGDHPQGSKADATKVTAVETAPPSISERQAFAKAAALEMTEAQMKLWERAMKEQAEGDAAAIAKRVLESERRRQTKEWKENREKLRPEVVAELNARPDIAAERMLKYGRLGDEDIGRVRIDPSYLTDEQRERMPKQYMAKDGLPPSVLAEMAGYPDGPSFIAGLETRVAERRQAGLRTEDFDRREVSAELDRRMEAQYGNLDQSILDMAQERVLAETQIEMLHEETLARAAAAGLEFSITREGFKDAIKADFDGLPVKGLKTDHFLRDAGKAGREAEAALLKGDVFEAFRQKQRQYANIVMGRLAKEFEGEMAKLDKLAKRYEARDIQRVDPATRYYIQGLLSEAGYRVRLMPDEIAREIDAYGHGNLGAFSELKYRDGYQPEVAQWLLEDGPKPLEQMTTAEALQFKEAIDSLNDIGRDINKVEVAGEKKDFADWKHNEVLPLLEARPIRELDQGPGRPERGSWFYGLDAMATRPEEMIRALDLRTELGPLYKGVIVPIEMSKAKSFEMLSDLTKRIRDMDKDLGNTWYKTLGDTIPQDFIFDTYWGSMFDLTRWNMVKMMLNWGAEQNAAKMIDGIARAQLPAGVKPAPEHLAYVQGRIEQLFAQHAKPEDWKFVKFMWDSFDGYRGDIETLQRNVGGKPPKWVEGRVIQTPLGPMEGKYFPLIVDKGRNVGVVKEGLRDVEGLFGKDYIRAATNQHHLDERTGAKYFVDISSGPEQLIGRLQQVIHDISFRDAVMNANKILGDSEIRAAINKHYGKEYYAQFDPWLKRIARMNNIDEVWLSGANTVMGRARVNLVMSALPLNPNVMFTPSLGTANVWDMVRFNSDRAANKALVMQHSKEIPHILYSLDRDATDAMSQIASKTSWTSFQKKAMETMYKPLVWMEQQTRMSTWYGQFLDQKAKGRTDFEAASWADSVVRQRHGVAHFADLSNLMASRNEFVRVPTIFMGYFSTMYNWAREMPDLARQGRKQDLMKVMWGVFGTAAMYNYLIFQKQRQDEPWYKHLAKSVLSTPFSMIPYVREGWGYFTEGYQPRSPVLSMITAVGNVIRDGINVAQGKRPKRPIRNIAEAVGGVAGVPGALQMGRSGEFLYDLSTGEQRPKNIIEWMRGFMWGESKLKK